MEKLRENDRGYAAPESSTIFNCDTSTGAIDSSFSLFQRFPLFSSFSIFARSRTADTEIFSYFSRLRCEARRQKLDDETPLTIGTVAND